MREASRETTFRVVVIVVVALLLLNLLIVVYFVHPAFNPDDDEGEVKEPGPEGDWLLPVDPVELGTDVVWEGLEDTVEAPLVVPEGRQLVIRDSHLRIHLEDLLFWLTPAFRVEPGANLSIEDSTVEVYQDPRLAASVVGAYQRPDRHVPHVARVVNLDGAVDPVFHMDVQWHGNATPVAVGVIPAGGEDLVLLDTFVPEDDATQRWQHCQVDLSEHAGTRPWVVTWFHSYPEAPVFVGNLSVMDGDAWPPGDMFPTGHPVKDGWLASRFSDIPSIQRGTFERGPWYGLERSWQPLMDAGGDVTVSGSSIIEPPGMGRKASGDIRKETLDPELVMRSDQAGAHGGHVGMVGGTLVVRDSRLVNVPVTGLNTTVRVEGTELRGDHDLVSLHGTRGHLEDCQFITDPLAPDNPFDHQGYRHPWAVAVEGSSPEGGLDIEDCLFSGNHVAIDLSHANVTVVGNTFEDVLGMAVWNHASEGVGWDELALENSFGEMRVHTYLESTVTDVEFVHPDNATEDIQVYSSASIQTWLDLYNPFVGQLRSVHGNHIRYIVPRTLVRGTGEVQTSRVVHADVGWNDRYEQFTFTPSEARVTIDLQELFAEDPSRGTVTEVRIEDVSPGPSRDVLQLSVLVTDLWSIDQADPTLELDVNGERVSSVPLTTDMVVGGDVVAPLDASLAPGWHDLNLAVRGREPLEGGGYAEEPSEVASLTTSFLVLSEVNDLEPWMPLEAEHLVVPEGVIASVELGEPRTPPARYHRTTRVLGWNGSRLHMDGRALEGGARSHLQVSGNVTLELVNARFAYLDVSDEGWTYRGDPRGAPISLDNVTANVLDVDGAGRDISLSDLRVREYLGVGTAGVSNVRLSTSVVDDATVDIDMWNGTLSIDDCTFRSHWSDAVYLVPFYADLTVRDCTFVGASLMVFFHSWYQEATDNLNVTGCTFTGEDALLYMGWDILNVDSYDVDPDLVPRLGGTVEGNLLDGEGSAAVLHHGLFDQVWGDNVVSDGARLYSFYVTRLQVIPPDGTPFWGAYDFLPAEDVVTNWPFGTFRWFELDGEVLYDVTDDITREADPPTLDVVLFGLAGNRHVRGFYRVAPDADNDEATYPVLPDLPELVSASVAHWPPLEGTD